jgi:hypothetical protein
LVPVVLESWAQRNKRGRTKKNKKARVLGYGPFSLWAIHKEGLCPSSGDINRLMMMIIR